MFNIYNEDCLEGMKELEDKSINLILTDLPYGITVSEWDTTLPLDKLWEQYERLITDNGVIVLFGQEPFSSKLRMSNEKLYKFDIYWRKQKPSNFQLMNYQPGRVTENICVFSKAKTCYTKNGVSMCYNPQMEKREKARKANAKIYGDGVPNLLHNYNTKDNYKIYEERHPINIVYFKTVLKGKTHPTEKPVKLLEYLIRTFSNEGDLVLDSCMGTGSTGVAALNTNRNFIGYEIVSEYFSIASKRMEEIENG